MITEIEMLDVEIKKLEEASRVIVDHMDSLDCVFAMYDVIDSIAILVQAKRLYRMSLIACLEYSQ